MIIKSESPDKQRYVGHVPVPFKRVHVELTNRCDFDCQFCPKSQMTRSYGNMDTNLAKDTIAEIGEKGIAEKVTFHVMGEPTLHPEFFEILDFAAKKGVRVGLTTNGGGLGGHVGRRLTAYDLHQLDISIQTPDEASFALRRAGKLQFEAYIGGILEFFSDYVKPGKKTIVKFRFMNTRFQDKGLEEKMGPMQLMSSTRDLRNMFRHWAGRIYALLDVPQSMQQKAFEKIDSLVSYKWNVVEIYPHVFFETYMLSNWGNALDDEGSNIRDAWAGYCFGMRDHFAVLHNGDVTLCCIDYDGHTVIGNVNRSSLTEILSSNRLDRILRGFRKFRLVHPHCRTCLGSRTTVSWLTKPIVSILSLKVLKPFFYKQTRLLP
jgi:MoaA/NifB/PqqE/SkfB family radical SAM enzyme